MTAQNYKFKTKIMVQKKTLSTLYLLLSLGMLFSCSQDDGKNGSELDEAQLILNASSTSVDEGRKVSFEVTAEGKLISGAQILINGTDISDYNHIFDTSGTYQAIAKKEGYQNSEPLDLTVIEKPEVYIAGFVSDFGISTAAYWKNGVRVNLTNGSHDAWAYSIFVHQGDVYVAGYEHNGSHDVAKYWKNGAPTSLTNGLFDAKAFSIFVYENDVYVAGNENGIAKYWKNGVPVNLPNGASAKAIFIYEGEVYVGGTASNGSKSVATYWKNGIPVSLTDGTNYASINSIYVFQGDVYAAGSEYNGNYYVAKYWKNGIPVILSTRQANAHANSIYISEGNVHVAGTIFIAAESTLARYWKNGTSISLSVGDGPNFSYAHSVYTYNNDVYVAGAETAHDFDTAAIAATYWKNGAPVVLEEPGFSIAYSIFVVED